MLGFMAPAPAALGRGIRWKPSEMQMTWKPHSRRSLLFVPGHDVRKLDRADAVGADTLILDLEDAVATSQKERAREEIFPPFLVERRKDLTSCSGSWLPSVPRRVVAPAGSPVGCK